jgi:hypothetical protein
MDAWQTRDLWRKRAYDSRGQYLGSIEAVAMGRDQVPRRVGIRLSGGRSLTFFSLEGAHLEAGRVRLITRATDSGRLRMLSGG